MSLAVILVGCAGSQELSSYDDVYYSPGDEELVATVDDAYIDSEVTDPVDTEYEEDYYDPESIEEYRTRDQVVNNYYFDDYYYSNRMRRFSPRANFGFGYYDPFLTYNYWNAYDPFFWGPRPWRPYGFSPGWGFGWNNNFGWSAGFNYGWGGYGFYDPFYSYGGWGYNPYGLYGNAYCPSYGGFGYGDGLYSSTPIYRGQYNSIGSFTSRATNSLGRGVKSEVATGGMQDLRPTAQPTDANTQTRPVVQGTRPVDQGSRPVEQGTRPVQNDWQKPRVAGTSPAQRPVDREVRPSSTRPATNTSRPATTQGQDYYAPRPTRTDFSSPDRDTRPVRDNGQYKPSREVRPSPTPRQREISRPSRPNSNSTIQRNTSRTSTPRSTVRSSSPSRSTGSSIKRSSTTTKPPASTRGSRSGGRR
ncbi:MAG: hypothetical protein HKN79_12550 [Flavobacteriales bacterium]|nr:hypothetical protein [Flavobacteriales bacterium]